MKKIILPIIIATLSTSAMANNSTSFISMGMAVSASAQASSARQAAEQTAAKNRLNIISETLIGKTVENCHILDAYYDDFLDILCLNVNKNEIYIKRISNSQEDHGAFSKKVFELLRKNFN